MGNNRPGSLSNFDKYLSMLELRDSYKLQIVTYVKMFLDQFKELTKENILLFLKEKNNQANIYRYLKKYTEFLYFKKQIPEDLYKDILAIKTTKRIRNKQKKRPKIINGIEIEVQHKWIIPKDQIESCYNQLDYETQRHALFICINWGLRANEVCNLQWKHIDLENGILKVRPTNRNPLKTETAVRDLPITPTQKQVLTVYKERTAKLNLDPDYLIYIPIGKNRHSYINGNNLYDWFSKVIVNVTFEGQEVPMKLHPHTCRYHFASTFFQTNGVKGLYALSKALGHKDIRTTQMYLAIDEKDLQADLLEGMLALNL